MTDMKGTKDAGSKDKKPGDVTDFVNNLMKIKIDPIDLEAKLLELEEGNEDEELYDDDEDEPDNPDEEASKSKKKAKKAKKTMKSVKGNGSGKKKDDPNDGPSGAAGKRTGSKK